ncbi:MAG: geranylgeranyl reductase family protein [Candidatus Aenigmatarchaeota archaeon]
MHDIVVVGAGPVGSMLASLCAKELDVLVLEEDDMAGRKACSGLVSKRFVGMLPRKVRNGDIVRHKVKAAIIHLEGKALELRQRDYAYVLDRDRLDTLMARHAQGCGAQIRYGESVTKISEGKGCMAALSNGKPYEASVICGCDGARSVAARHMNVGPVEILNGLIIHEKRRASEDFVEMWFCSAALPDGFFWKIPRGDCMEYGCMGKAVNFKSLERFFSLHGRGGLSRAAAPIPIGSAERTYADRMILAGDAAGQTKPWSGGGLTYGLIAAGCAAKTLEEASIKRDFSAALLSGYERSWKGILSRDIGAGMLLREMLKDMDPGALSSIVAAAGALSGRAAGIDFDFPFSGVLGKAVRLNGE